MTSLRTSRATHQDVRAAFTGAPLALLAFPAFWALGVGLAQIHLLAIQRPWSTVTWIVVAVVPIAYVLGGLIAREWIQGRARPSASLEPTIPVVRRRHLRWTLLAIAVVGNLEEAHQFAVGRTIPLLSSHIDAARFALPGGPTIILTDLLTVAAVLSLVLPRHLIARSAVPELGIAAFALLGFALAAGRGPILQTVTVALIARWLLYGRLSFRLLVLCAMVGLAFSTGLFYLRTSQHQNDALGVELRQNVYPTLPRPLRPLVPADLALATNLEALARIVDYFPAVPYGHGAYSAHGFDLFIPGTRDLEQLSARLSPPWVTSTVAGPLWADGGLVLVVAGMAIIGAMVAATEVVARVTREMRFILVAANFAFLALFGVYVNLWTQQVDWIVITPLLYGFGAVAEGFEPIPAPIRARLRRPASLRSLLKR